MTNQSINGYVHVLPFPELWPVVAPTTPQSRTRGKDQHGAGRAGWSRDWGPLHRKYPLVARQSLHWENLSMQLLVICDVTLNHEILNIIHLRAYSDSLC